MARDKGLSPSLTAQYLAIPLLCPEGRMPEEYSQLAFSYEQNKDSPVIPKQAIDMFLREYQPNKDDSVNFAIFNHPQGHRNLPRTYLQVDAMDPLRDEALIFERVLREENGVKTKISLYSGMPHGHWSFPSLKASAQFRKDQLEGMGWLLGRVADFSKVKFDEGAAAV